MNLENVKEGMVFKNYKDLCFAMDIPVKGGKSKEYHLLDLKRYFDYTKSGNNFIINSIRDEPLEQIPRGYNPYGDLIQILLLDLVLKQEEQTPLYLSCSAMLSSLSMVNDKYNYFRYHTNKLYDATKINKTHIAEWYDMTHANLKNSLESTLNALERKALIYWSYSVTFVSQKKEHYKADDDEVAFLLGCEKNVLDELRCIDKSDLFKKNKWNEFSDKVNALLYEEYGTLFYYKSYEVIYNRNKEHIKIESEKLKYTLNEHERMEKQYELNNIVLNKLSTNAEIRVDKASAKYVMDLTEKELVRIDDAYLENNNLLCETLIKK